MPSLTTTIEDNSPLISYSSGWLTGSSADNAASLYSQSSFMLTQAAGATATFSFNGTGVQIFGSKRGNHGLYQVRVDDTVYPATSGSAPDPGLYQQPLFTVTGLKQGRHEMTLTNQEAKFVDVDFITWETDIGTGSKLFTNTFQDTDPSFVYSPSVASWTTNPKNLGSFFGGSGHATSSPGSSLVYTFKATTIGFNIGITGDGISIYGPVGPDGSPYSVQLDNNSARNFSLNQGRYTPQMLLYHANNLGPGKHSLKVMYQPVTSGQVFAVDYANVYTTAPPQQDTTSMSLSAGSIVGITLSIVGIFGVLAGLFIFLRRRQLKDRHIEEKLRGEPLPFEKSKQSSAHLSNSSFGPTVDRSLVSSSVVHPFPLALPVPQPAAVTRPAWNTSTHQTERQQVRFAETQEELAPESASSEWSSEGSFAGEHPSSSALLTHTNSMSPRRGLPPQPQPYRKGSPVQLPTTAGRSLGDVPEEELRANRRVVDGRAQDFGASSSSAVPFVSTPRDNDEALPPDYSQATEPYGSGHVRS